MCERCRSISTPPLAIPALRVPPPVSSNLKSVTLPLSPQHTALFAGIALRPAGRGAAVITSGMLGSDSCKHGGTTGINVDDGYLVHSGNNPTNNNSPELHVTRLRSEGAWNTTIVIRCVYPPRGQKHRCLIYGPPLPLAQEITVNASPSQSFQEVSVPLTARHLMGTGQCNWNCHRILTNRSTTLRLLAHHSGQECALRSFSISLPKITEHFGSSVPTPRH